MNRPGYISFILFLLIILIFKAVMFEFYTISSTSMEKTLLPGDFVLVNKMIYGTDTPNRIYFPFTGRGIRIPSVRIPGLRPVKQGEIVVVKNDNYPGCTNNMIKRVAATEGQTMTFFDGLIFVDGILVNNKHGKEEMPDIMISESSSYKSVMVPENKLYLLGDNFVYSYDSRDFGFVDTDDVIGKAVLIYASKDENGFRWGRFLKKPE